MPQINNGLVRLVNDSTTVQAMYNVYLSSAPAELVAGEIVQWGAASAEDGRGTIAEVDGTSYWIYRTNSDPTDRAPIVGDDFKLVTGASVTPTIVSMGAASPPNWSTLLAGAVGTPVFTIRDNTSPALHVASSTADELTLTSVWPGDDVTNVDYGITTDFTPAPFNLPLVAYGDIDSPALISMAITEIARNLVFSGALLTTDAALTVNVNTYTQLTNLKTVTYDIGGWVAADDDSFFTVPTGVTMVRVMGCIVWETEGGADDRRSARIYKNDAGNFVGMARPDAFSGGSSGTPSQVSGCYTAAVQVEEGDTFELYAYSRDGQDVLDDNQTWFSIEAVSFV